MIEVHASTPKLEAAMASLGIKNSTAIRAGDLYFFSGLTAVDLQTGQPVPGGIREHARYTLDLFAGILGELGLTLDHVIKVNCYLAETADFAAWNEVYLDVFDAPYPCRTTVGSPLVLGSIEVEMVAATEPRR
ncbi:MAG: RidA family protein [Acidimicrobiia bacterium]|nr:RidA family protein [Acidimicrobiia bacterium]